ncbi:soxH protein [Pseudosulfitobacter pseudonitzschiae]|uniref:SoxH protein n=2 Tax=Rhodobacterales TaxID=204455 RepID=A0A221JWS7_9RHOB|nr:soxH protein [Pseudosulfitobacter pseudonitzschiae]
MEFLDRAKWPDSVAAIEALNSQLYCPPTQPLTTLAQARAGTRNYLQDLRDRMRAHIDDGAGVIGSVDVDRSAFFYPEQFDALAGRNAQANWLRLQGAEDTSE